MSLVPGIPDVILLEYVVHDIFSGDEKKVKQAKKALIDSIDHYCLQLLRG